MRELILSKKIMICCGSGGVGKTTLSAALGLMAAGLGRKTLVCTIDPAKRLADSLGLRTLDNQERAVEAAPGEMWAMMLDCKTTFDRLVERYAPSPEVCERILANPFYQAMSYQATGSHEYMAMEKLYELVRERDYELIILDTPPTRHALDFLEAPQRMIEFFDEQRIGWFMAPTVKAGRVSLDLFRNATLLTARMLKKVVGFDLLQQIRDFFQSFKDMYQGFRERAQHVQTILHEPHTTFVITTSPENVALQAAHFLAEQLGKQSLALGALIINRVHPQVQALPPLSQLEATLEERFPQHGRALFEICHRYYKAGQQDQERVAAFCARLPSQVPRYQVPLLEKDIADIQGLQTVAEFLQTPGPPPDTPA